VDYSSTTQDSLPVAGQALLDGLPTRKIPMKAFKSVIYISFPFPKLLGAIDETSAPSQAEFLRVGVRSLDTAMRISQKALLQKSLHHHRVTHGTPKITGRE
jgi:hypothetical protein